MEKAKLWDCLEDPLNRPLTNRLREEYKLRPHTASFNESLKRLLVYVTPGDGGDYPINLDMLKAVCEYQNTGRITIVYIVQLNRDRDKVVAYETAMNVARKINGAKPLKGTHGPYVWVTEGTFMLAGSELPF